VKSQQSKVEIAFNKGAIKALEIMYIYLKCPIMID